MHLIMREKLGVDMDWDLEQDIMDEINNYNGGVVGGDEMAIDESQDSLLHDLTFE